MDEETREVIVEETAAPRWMGIAIVVLAITAAAGLAVGWSASNREKTFEQSVGTQFAKSNDMLGQRLAKAEDTNAQLQGELSVVTDKMKLTEDEFSRARVQAKKIKEADDKQLADLQSNVSGQLATKANVDDVNKLGTDVDGVKTDLDSTKSSLNLARGEFGTLIAKNHDDIEELRRLGERDYYEFTIDKKGQRTKVGGVMVELHGVNTKKNLYSVALYVDDTRYDKKNRSTNEPIYFFTTGSRAPVEFVVNQVAKDKIAGYMSMPKVSSTHAPASGN
jgi:hypothetical protein